MNPPFPDNQALLARAKQARENAYAPYSQYKVGSALLASSGKVYIGTNVETCNWASICSERTAFTAAVANGERSLKKIAIMTAGDQPGTPCGDCRQFMAEFADDDFEVILGTIDGKTAHYRLGELLPHAFRPARLPQNQPDAQSK
ncbi:MAG: cytidine deaminase [Bacteriovoracia bacterium]